jgi:hypothetical protein
MSGAFRGTLWDRWFLFAHTPLTDSDCALAPLPALLIGSRQQPAQTLRKCPRVAFDPETVMSDSVLTLQASLLIHSPALGTTLHTPFGSS